MEYLISRVHSTIATDTRAVILLPKIIAAASKAVSCTLLCYYKQPYRQCERDCMQSLHSARSVTANVCVLFTYFFLFLRIWTEFKQILALALPIILLLSLLNLPLLKGASGNGQCEEHVEREWRIYILVLPTSLFIATEVSWM